MGRHEQDPEYDPSVERWTLAGIFVLGILVIGGILKVAGVVF